MKPRSDDRKILDGLGAPHPPAHLRARVLSAARRAAEQHAPISGWRAIAALFAAQPRWTAALVAVLAAHVILAIVSGEVGSPRPSRPRDVEVEAQPDLLRLPLIEDAGLGSLATRLDETSCERGRS